jgi:hypothetical protein
MASAPSGQSVVSWDGAKEGAVEAYRIAKEWDLRAPLDFLGRVVPLDTEADRETAYVLSIRS